MNDKRPSRLSTLMGVAGLYAERSTCDRLHVGAVIAREGRILGTGYNGAPSGMPHCSHSPDDSSPCSRSVHAELNAIAFAARHGVATQLAEMYVTDTPCLPCAQLIVNCGITDVWYARQYRDKSGLNLLHEAGVIIRYASLP